MWNDGGGWSDEDEDNRMPEDMESSISPPSAPSHVSKVLCMGALCKPGRFSFSASTTYICSLVGDKFYYARGEGRAGGLQNMQQQPQHRGGMKGCKTISLSKLRRVRFQYNHTVEEHSLKRNRITFEYDIAPNISVMTNENASALGTPEAVPKIKKYTKAKQQKGAMVLTFSAPSDKDMFRWEACLRSVAGLCTLCRSVLKDHMGRLRPFQHGMGHFSRRGGTGASKSTPSISSNIAFESAKDRKEHQVATKLMFETVRSIWVQLPDELGVMHISLGTSSLRATIADLKATVFENIRQMQKKLLSASGFGQDQAEGDLSASAAEKNLVHVGISTVKPASISSALPIPSSSSSTFSAAATSTTTAAAAAVPGEIIFRESPKTPKEGAPRSRVSVRVTRQQFINPLALATSIDLGNATSANFRTPRAGSPLSDANHLPNQVMNPFVAMQERQNRKLDSTTSSSSARAESEISDLVSPTTPSEALARHELKSIENIMRRGANAFLLYRPFRKMDADIGAELWAFEEHKSVESLSTGGSDVLKLELRAASDMPHSGIRCAVRMVKAKDIFGKVTDHYHIHILAADLSWDVKYKFPPIKKFATSLRSAYLELPLEQRMFLAKQHFGHGQPNGYQRSGFDGENPLPLPSLAKLLDSVESVQKYLDSVLAHPWASTGHHLLEFLGAATTARNRTNRMVVHISQLCEYVSPGDIVLFKCSDRWSGLTRLVLRDRFDHVGVIVPGKTPGSSLRILESTGEGVKTYPLVGRLRGYFLADFVHFISVRRIVAPREKSALARCAEFVSAVEGKPYRLRQAVVGRMRGRHIKAKRPSASADGASEDVQDSTQKVSQKMKAERRRSMDGSQSGYFCSEITAAYLKHLGFIGDRDADCAAYWPGDYDEGGVVEQDVLRMGFHMEKLVDLDLRIVELAKAERRAGASARRRSEVDDGIKL